MTPAQRYRAFMSYSHADSLWAKRLQRALERYVVPRGLVGRPGRFGPVPRRLGPIFRDREDLPASGDLSEVVQAALANSDYLIVLCSPQAAQSFWVNREIEEFKRLTGADERVLAVILDGEPFGSETGVGPECFPPALRRCVNADGHLTDLRADPAAADMRPGQDGRKNAVLKLVAGLIGSGLDDLIRRDSRRRHRSVMGITVGSVLGMLAMAVLAGIAYTAQQEAEARRADAEGLIEFMLTDLRDRLDEVGRLDILDAVGERAQAYYDSQSPETISDSALGRRATAFRLLGEIDDKQGDSAGAMEMFQAAYETTGAMLDRAPSDPERLYDHAQSAYWVGYQFGRLDEEAHQLDYFKQYDELAAKLAALDENNTKWQLERAYAKINLGVAFLHQQAFESALAALEQGLALLVALPGPPPDPNALRLNIANTHAWISDCLRSLDRLEQAKHHRRTQIQILEQTHEAQKDDWRVIQYLNFAFLGLGHLEMAGKRDEQALQALRRALHFSDLWKAHDPSDLRPFRQEVRALTTSAMAHLNIGNMAGALTHYRRARASLRHISASFTLTEDQERSLDRARFDRLEYALRQAVPDCFDGQGGSHASEFLDHTSAQTGALICADATMTEQEQ